MKPKHHKIRLLRWMTRIRNEVAVMHQEQHFQCCGYKNLETVEHDIEGLMQEIDRKELSKGET